MRKRDRHTRRRRRSGGTASGEQVFPRGQQIAGDHGEGPGRILQAQFQAVTEVQQRGVDGHLVSEHRLHRKRVEAALQLPAAVEDDRFRGRPAGLVVADMRSAPIGRDLQPVDKALDPQARVRNFDRERGIPGQECRRLRLHAAEGDLGKRGSAGAAPVPGGQRLQAQRTRLLEGPLPENARRHGPRLLPAGGHPGDPVLHGDGNLFHASRSQSAIRLQSPQRIFQRLVDQVSHRQRLQQKGLLPAVRRPPSQAVEPQEAERIPQQQAQGAGRLRLLQDGPEHRMPAAHKAVMGRQLPLSPVAPARGCRLRPRQRPEFRRASRDPVRFTEGVLRNPVALQIGFFRLRRQQRAAAQKTAFAVAPRPGQRHQLLRRGQDRFEIPLVRRADGQGVQLHPRQNVFREKPVLRNAARPARRVQSQQPRVFSRRRGQHGRRRPENRAEGIGTVLKLQHFQRPVERCRRPRQEGLPPDGQCLPAEQTLADRFGRTRALREERHDFPQRRTAVVPAGPVGRCQAPDELLPGLRARQRRIGGQDAGPAPRQVPERAGQGRQKGRQTSYPGLAGAPQQDVRHRGSRLALAGGSRPDAVGEMHVETGVAAQRTEMVVVLRRARGCDGDLPRLGLSRCQELPCPPHGLEGLVIRRRRACALDCRALPFRGADFHRAAVEPGRNGPGSRQPPHGRLPCDGKQQRPPARRKLGDAPYLDRPEQRRRMLEPLQGLRHQVRRPQESGRQFGQNGLLETCERCQPGVPAGSRLEIDSGAPCLAQRVGCRADKAGQVLDRIELPQLRVRQGGLDPGTQALVVDGAQQAARQPGCELFERHGLQAVRAVSSRLQHGIPHREAAVHDGAPAPGWAGFPLFGHAVSVYDAANRIARARCRAARWHPNSDPILCSYNVRNCTAESQ